jgi:hypothetical protein
MRRIAAAIALIAVTVGVAVARAPGQALGPVVPITPFEVDTGGGFVGWIGDLDMSGRGETAGVRDDEVRDIGFVAFDDGDAEPMVPGDGIGVSGDGCTAVAVENGDGFTSLRVINRCAGSDVVVAELPFNIGEATVNVTFDGRFAALHYRRFVPSITVTIVNTVQRLDTTTGELIAMPAPAGFPLVAAPELHSDISDDGLFVVAPVAEFQRTALAVWDVAGGTSNVVVDAATGRWAAFPSLSGDGAWIAFASNQPRDLGEVGRGPWVYVIARATGEPLRVSPAELPAYYTSISRDGTQVAFAVSNGVVPPPTTTTTTIPPIIILAAAPRGTDPVPTCPNPAEQGIWQLQQTCPPARIDVAFSSTPGLSGAQTETVSLDAGGQQTGEHWHPELSGNGRWVAWISNAGNSLIGQNADLDGLHHAYMRRRDPGLVVDDLTFPPVQVNTITDASTTVRNTGRTSVWLDEITTDPADPFVAVGGTCVRGMSLAPGATCSVVVRFTPGPNPGTSSATLRVGETETNHDPVFDQAALAGTASSQPIDTTTSSTTTTTSTTVPEQPPTTTTTPPTQPTTTTRPTTPPGAATLSATPNPVDFGAVAVGFASEPRNVTVGNGGTAGGLVQTSLDGTHADDFWVRTNGCVGATLAVGRDCQIEVLLIPTGGGIRTATLRIAAGTSVVNVTLRGNGTFQPRLVPMPAAVSEHGISTVYGQGFPPGETFTVTVAETGLTLQGTADATGLFRAFLSTAGRLHLGNYTLHVDGMPDVFGDVEANLLVQVGSFRPQGAGGPAFGNSNLIVSRGR